MTTATRLQRTMPKPCKVDADILLTVHPYRCVFVQARRRDAHSAWLVRSGDPVVHQVDSGADLGLAFQKAGLVVHDD